MTRHLVVGAGIAGLSAALELRRRDEQAEITLVSGESHPTYFRAGLSGWMLGEVEDEELFVRPHHRWERSRIQAVPGTVLTVDMSERKALLADGQALAWDRLLLATGARPRLPDWPNADLDGILVCRTWDEARDVVAGVRAAAEAMFPVLVVGGGILGLELAHVARTLGASVVLLARESRPGHPLFGPEPAARILARLREAGVTVALDESPSGFEGEGGRVTSVVTDEARRLLCGTVLVAVGVEPVLGPLAHTALVTDGEIRVDETLRTRNEDVFAAGDVARVWDPGLQRHVGCRTWELAYRSGVVAGANMAGGQERLVPSRATNTSRVFDLPYALLGEHDARGDDVERVADRAPEGPHAWRELVLRKGVLVGAVFLQDRRQLSVYARLVQQGASLSRHRGRLFAGDANALLPEGELDYRFY